MRLKEKIALITGGAKGIGCGFAADYVAEGATVVIADINLAGAERTATERGSSVSAVAASISS
jgi:NAD(P)-dependent dehydrogenase (short-subunit alcohol dehydrogenase family)